MKKRVLILPYWYPDEKNPLFGIYVHEQAVAMSKQYEVAVLLVKPVGWNALLRGKLHFRSHSYIVDGVPVYVEQPFVLVPRVLWFAYLAFVLGTMLGIKRMTKIWGRPDLLHVHIIMPIGYAAVKAGKRYGIPVVLTEHSTVFLSQLQTKLQRNTTVEALRRATQVMTVSPFLANQIRSLVPEVWPVVVGNLARTDYFTPAEKPFKTANPIIRFLMVGFLSDSRKGVSVLLDAAYLLLVKGITDFEVIIGGDGPQRPEFEQQSKRLQLTHYCRFLGMLDRTQTRDEMRKSDVFVLPSFYETFGIVLVEAMACGKPVISTYCGGPEYIVTPDTGLLVEPGNAQELADAMEKFISRRIQFNPQTIRQSAMSRFGREIFVSNVSSVYENAMKSIK